VSRRFAGFLLTALLAFVHPAFAVEPDEILADPGLEARARALSGELRCMVCQNQSIDDSNADLARDLRILLRERLTAGDTDAEVLDFMVARYGEFILLRPRVAAHTILLWATPLIVLVIGGIVAVMVVRRKSGATVAELSDAERRKLAALGVDDTALASDS
jgi:cytochrome c-type biogenesis protein CcmH